MNPIRSLTLAAASTVLLAACSTTVPLKDNTQPAPAPVPAPMAPAPMAPAPQAAPVPMAQAQTTALPAYLDPSNPLSSQRSIYFGYDIFSVKADYAKMLELHGKFLAANPQVSIRVEGNADERGSSEYNLALGQKRADAVVRALKLYGVKDSQMESVSFGREKPKALGHDEDSWAQNRRVDLDYPKN